MILFQAESGQVKQGEQTKTGANVRAEVATLGNSMLTAQDMLNYFSKDVKWRLDERPTAVQIDDHVKKSGTPEQKKAWNNLIGFFGSLAGGFWKGK